MPDSPSSSAPLDRRQPPRDEDAERALLGSALLDGARIIDLCGVRQITPASFYHPNHRNIFEAMFRLHHAQEVVDIVSLCGRLEETGLLEKMGGREAILALIDATPTAAHADYYIQRVHEKEMLRRIMDHSRKAIEACYNPDRDVSEILNEAEQSLFEIAENRKVEAPPWKTLVKDAFGNVERILRGERGTGGLSTGFQSLDEVVLGLRGGEMVVLAARPSMGKTSLAMNIAEHVATGRNPRTGVGDGTPRPVAVFSLEMGCDQLALRMLCSRAGVNSVHLRKTRYLSAPDHERLIAAAHALSAADILVDDMPGLTALELRARARRMKRRHDIQLIVVDYLQLMNFPQFAREGRQREVMAISSAIKAMARELNVPALVLSQLNREVEVRSGQNNAPRLSDLRDSGAIEQDADVVMLLRRPCKMSDAKAAMADPMEAIVDVAKHRNGQTGEVTMNFFDDLVRFEDRLQRPNQDREPEPALSGGMEE